MSDFLRRLAGRSLGIEPVVQPVIPATTAPAPGGFLERENVHEAVEGTSNAERPRSPQAPAVREGAERIGSFEAAVAEPRPTAARESPAEPAPVISATALASPESTLPAIETRADAREESATAPSAWDRTLPDPAKPGPAIAFVAMPTERREPAAPVVRVTIGRVEVKAELSQPKVRSAAPRTRPASTSLDDYLKQRAEGRR